MEVASVATTAVVVAIITTTVAVVVTTIAAAVGVLIARAARTAAMVAAVAAPHVKAIEMATEGCHVREGVLGLICLTIDCLESVLRNTPRLIQRQTEDHRPGSLPVRSSRTGETYSFVVALAI